MLPSKKQGLLASLEEDDQRAKTNGLLLGRYVSVASGESVGYYKIVGLTKTLAKLRYQDIGSDVVPEWGDETEQPLRTIRAMIARRDAMENEQEWWRRQRVGTRVHYKLGPNRFLRAVVITFGGQKQILPTHFVGEWDEQSLKDYLDHIRHHKPLLVKAADLWEHQEPQIGPSPAELPVIQLEPEPVSTKSDQGRLIDVVRLRNKVQSVLSGVRVTGDLDKDVLAYQSALNEARRLLA